MEVFLKKITMFLWILFLFIGINANNFAAPKSSYQPNTVWHSINVSNQKNNVIHSKNRINKKQLLQKRQLAKKLARLFNEKQTLLVKNQKSQDENEILQNKNTESQQTITQLQDQNTELQQKIIQLQTKLNVILQQQISVISPFMSSYPKLEQIIRALDLPFALVCAIVIIILLFLWLILKSFRRPERILVSQKVKQNVPASESEKDINYKYLAGEDVVTAKLNLAHAYCDMESYASAKEILASIVKEGTEQQREEARGLLAKINKS